MGHAPDPHTLPLQSCGAEPEATMGLEGSGSTLWCGGVAFLGPRVSYLIAHRPSPKILPISLTHRTDRCFQFVGRRLARPSKLPV